MKRFICSLVIAALLATPSLEAAAQNALEQARILFDAGVQAYTAGRYEEAVESFHEAYLLTDKPQVLFSLAQAERRLYVVSQDARHLRQCIDHFRKYLEIVTEGGRRSDAVEALEQLDVLAARETQPVEATTTTITTTATGDAVTGRILISTTTPDATISIDGAKSAASPALAVVKLGKHLVRVSAPGYITEEREIVAIEKTLVPVEISLREEPAYLSLTTRDDALIAIDGRLYGQAPIRKRIELHRGPHTVSISLAGYRLRSESIQLDSGQSTSLHLSLDRTRQRIVSYVLLGAAGAGFVGSIVQGGLALRKDSAGDSILAQTKSGNITQKQLEEYNMTLTSGDILRTSARITASSASALGLAGAIMYFFDTQRTMDEPSTNPDKVAVSFLLTPSTAGLGFSGRF